MNYKELHEKYKKQLDQYFDIDNSQLAEVEGTFYRYSDLIPRSPKPEWPRLSFVPDDPDTELLHNYQRHKWELLAKCHILIGEHVVGQIQRRPHPEVKLKEPKSLKASTLLARNLFIKLLHEDYPQVKISYG